MTYRRVPDAVQRSSRCSAEPGPNPEFISWTPDQQRTTPQGRRVAQHPGHAMGAIVRWARVGFVRKKIVARARIQFSNTHMFIERDPAFPRREAPEVLQKTVRPEKQRAQGMPGAQCTHSLACEID